MAVIKRAPEALDLIQIGIQLIGNNKVNMGTTGKHQVIENAHFLQNILHEK